MLKGISVEVKNLAEINAEEKLFDKLKSFNQYALYVGIPQETSDRNGEITNAELAFIHTNGVYKKNLDSVKDYLDSLTPAARAQMMETGSPLYRIPPRPFIQPSLNKHSDQITRSLERAAKRNLKEGKSGLTDELAKLGLRCQNWIRRWFTDPENGWPPNAPGTIKAKGSSKPLINTGELRKSITYVIRKGGRDID